MQCVQENRGEANWMTWTKHYSDAHHFGWGNTKSLLTVQEKREWCQPHTNPTKAKAPRQLLDVTAFTATKTAKEWWLREDTIGPFVHFGLQLGKPNLHHGCDLREVGFPPLDLSQWESPSVSGQHTGESIFRHANRNLPWNMIHD